MSPFIKIGLYYDKNQNTPKENSNSKATKPSNNGNEEETKLYVDVLKSSIKNEGNKKNENYVL